MRSRMISGACFATVFAICSLSATGLDRFVVVNGELLDAFNLAQLDAAAGEHVPDGRYWLNLETGAWGYEGGPLMGYIGRPVDEGPSLYRDGDPSLYDEDVRDGFCEQNPGICP